ncbi:hypothetical protein RHMOL_Rhmol10G0071800 [Rhododendron molle]|uniref:Uncharacterized protein n=1 Tax=Rhododendron molle TaxID=49168 RepID=A0ACC0M100_RHOML|nr:hypothetical protein RHMOL_Rhmol10G0071800 [Rhododendron molle]
MGATLRRRSGIFLRKQGYGDYKRWISAEKALDFLIIAMAKKAMALVDELTPDVLMDILSRLPAKSLLRCKSVSKYWYSLILNPNFISLHRTRAQPYYYIHLIPSGTAESSMYMVPDETSIEQLDLSFTGPHLKEFCHGGSSRGLMCLFNFKNSDIVLCNPAMRESRLLPRPPSATLRTTYLGFAFIPQTNDYNVVRLATIYESDLKKPFESYDDDEAFRMHIRSTHTSVEHKVQIYSMSTDSWKEIGGMVPNYYLYPRSRTCMSLDGVFYWSSYSSNDYSANVCVINALNMVGELYERISLPAGICDEYPDLCLLDDSLALVASKDDCDLEDTCFDVWLMDKYGVDERWTKRYTIGRIGPLLGCDFVIGFRPNNEILLAGGNDWEFLSYNLSTHDMKEYKQLCNWSESFYLQQVFSYSESLVSVKRQVDLT